MFGFLYARDQITGQMEGDTKGSGKGHEGSSRKDNLNAQFGIQNPYTQGLNYGNSQSQVQGQQHMMVPMQRTE
ncbi:unnamed protein product [Lactuca virosa]|uniref:Uncharacterized protein n=1 Tax=Lactuca virosa TaxID=75947 RepID=A0AAU9NKH0_9ASTR|nr:unnamed protein product [Lactuca virosa]